MPLNAASLKKLEKVKPDLVKVVKRAADITTQPFQIVQGNRTQAEQNALYAQGRTKKGPIVTWTKNSKHIGGGAIDFAALVGGKISWTEKFYPIIAKAFKQAAAELGIGIEWGGDWKTKDWGHVQLTGKAAVAVVDAGPPALKRGAKGADVTELQRLLKIKADGDFGPLTHAAVVAFQKAQGIGADGAVGPATWVALRSPTQPVTTAAASDNPSIGMARLQEKHRWPRHHAAAFLGRAQQESYKDIRTGVEGDKEEPSGSAHGAWQWRMDREANLKKFAEERGVAWTDWPTQIDFMVSELNGPERRAARMLYTADTLEKAVAAAMAYTRPAGFKYVNPDEHGWDEAIKAASKGHGWTNTLKNAQALMK